MLRVKYVKAKRDEWTNVATYELKGLMVKLDARKSGDGTVTVGASAEIKGPLLHRTCTCNNT
jgi:hypothetical protein